MWTLDFAEDFSGLSTSQIHRLEQKGIITPVKRRGAKYYEFGDIYVLRLYRLLRRAGIAYTNITHAFEYLKQLGNETPLSSFLLGYDNKHVFTYFHPGLVNATQGGQIILDGTLPVLSVGTELEGVRLRMQREAKSLKRSTVKAVKEKEKGLLKSYTKDTLNQLLA